MERYQVSNYSLDQDLPLDQIDQVNQEYVVIKYELANYYIGSNRLTDDVDLVIKRTSDHDFGQANAIIPSRQYITSNTITYKVGDNHKKTTVYYLDPLADVIIRKRIKSARS